MRTNNSERHVKGNVKLAQAKHNAELQSTWKASGEKEHYPFTTGTRSPIKENSIISAARSHLAMARLSLRIRKLKIMIPEPPSHRQALPDGPHKILGPTWSETRREPKDKKERKTRASKTNQDADALTLAGMETKRLQTEQRITRRAYLRSWTPKRLPRRQVKANNSKASSTSRQFHIELASLRKLRAEWENERHMLRQCTARTGKAVSTFKILQDESLRKNWKSHALAMEERRQKRAARSQVAHIKVRDATEKVEKAEEAMLAKGETPELWRNTSGLSTVHNAKGNVADSEMEKKSRLLRLGHALGRFFGAL
ncbi:MAG: hypothetical protein LQ350_001680 [Teloschistes chrysophthalmus]|nr:MAG: hypothetical protein LQ350_001680 [Niorma chrysophthalma]